jgi:hypothetical protein
VSRQKENTVNSFNNDKFTNHELLFLMVYDKTTHIPVMEHFYTIQGKGSTQAMPPILSGWQAVTWVVSGVM